MDPIELSNYAGLAAIGFLTVNILLGLVLTVHYNPVRRWPHRRLNTVKYHNVIGWLSLLVSLVHPALLLLPSRVPFGLVDLVYPVNAPKQPWVNTAGAVAVYILIFVLVTSYFRFQLGRRWWKRMHFANYALFPLFAVHSVLTDPSLRDNPIDYLDGEKVYIELCIVAVMIAIALRVRWQQRQPKRVHRVRARARSLP